MRLVPKSIFARIALLIAGLLLINQIITYISVTNYVIRPHWQQILRLMSTQVKFVVMDLENELPDDVSETYMRTTGIRVYPYTVAVQQGLLQARHYQSLTQLMTRYLDAKTDVLIQEGDAQYLWVRAPKHPDKWIRLPLANFQRNYPSPLIIYLTAIGILSVLGGWFLTLLISRPLKKLQFAVRELGRGDVPGQLKETGASEFRELTRAFNQMAHNIHQLEEDRALLLAGVSHDIRTPLTRIRLAAEFLPNELQEVRDDIVRDAEEMNAIIEQFIAFVREGREEPWIWCQPDQLIHQVLESFNERDRFVQHTRKLPKTKLRPLAFKRMLTNVVQNAIRYSDGPVEISTSHDKHWFTIEVRDHGPGVPNDQIERLFQPFQRGNTARSGQTGSGLGLAIVRRIVEAHHGKLSVRNHPGGGLLVTISLPLSNHSH